MGKVRISSKQSSGNLWEDVDYVQRGARGPVSEEFGQCEGV